MLRPGSASAGPASSAPRMGQLPRLPVAEKRQQHSPPPQGELMRGPSAPIDRGWAPPTGPTPSAPPLPLPPGPPRTMRKRAAVGSRMGRTSRRPAGHARGRHAAGHASDCAAADGHARLYRGPQGTVMVRHSEGMPRPLPAASADPAPCSSFRQACNVQWQTGGGGDMQCTCLDGEGESVWLGGANPRRRRLPQQP